MAFDLQAATTAVGVARLRHAEAAAALRQWSLQEASLPNKDLPKIRAEFLRRAAVIDAAYSVSIEPYRHAFMEQHPGEPLPVFLQPEGQSFSDQLQPKQATAPAKHVSGTSSASPATGWAGMSYGSRLIAVIAAIVLVLVAIVVTTNVVSQNKPRAPYAAPVSSMTDCERSMQAAADEPDSTKADPLIIETLQTCKSKAVWVAALTKYPAAMGMYEVTGTEWAVACMGYESAPACKG